MNRRPYTHVNNLTTLEDRIVDTLRHWGPMDGVELVSFTERLREVLAG